MPHTCLQTNAFCKWNYNKLHVFKSFLLLSPFATCRKRRKKNEAYNLREDNCFNMLTRFVGFMFHIKMKP